jgi:transcriptional regulator with GAF, ATPase, and Fis domain
LNKPGYPNTLLVTGKELLAQAVHALSPRRKRVMLEVNCAAPPAPLGEVERQQILEVLGRTGWRVAGNQGAAALLGLKRTTLEGFGGQPNKPK